MMKSATICALLLLSVLSLNAQWQYANEWIAEVGYDKSFYHFEVNQEGIIQIPAEAFSDTNLPVEHAQWRVFTRGEEVPIRVVASGPNLIAGDYIELYAIGNDGYFDEQLYASPLAHTTPDLSLFNDAISYYITWSEEGTGLRFQEIENEVDSSMEPISYFMHSSKILPNSTYYAGESFELANAVANYSDFEEGEGFVSNLITKDSPISFDIATKSVYQEAGVEAEMQFKILGREDDTDAIIDHFVEVTLNDELYLEAIYDGYVINTYEFSVDLADLDQNETEITFNPTGELCDDCDDRNSVAYIDLTYPHSFDLENEAQFYIPLGISNDSQYIVAENFNGSSENTFLYDLKNHWFLAAEEVDDNYEFMLPAGVDSGEERAIFISNLDHFSTVTTIDTLAPITFTDFSDLANQGDYIIIFHPSLNDAENEELPVSQYAAYRTAEQGGNYEVIMVSIDQLYHQFGHGITQHPQGIRHFINYAIENWSETPEHLFLIGKAIDYATAHFNEDQTDFNLLPTYGFPSSDNTLTTCCIDDYRPRLTVGRLSALNTTEVSNYLSKITAHESLDWTTDSCNIDHWTWPKKMISLASVSTIDDEPEDGIADDLIATNSYLDDIKANVEGDQFKGEELARLIELYEFPSSTISPFVPSTEEYDEVINQLNQGVGLINLIEGNYNNGLWGMTNFELNPSLMGSDDKYPSVFNMANFIGDFTNSTNNISLGESLILAPNSGAISYFGSVSFDYKEYAGPHLTNIYEELTNGNLLMGAAIQQVIADNYVDIITDPVLHNIGKVMSQAYHFEGDPVVRIPNIELPDYNFEDISTDLVFEPSFLTTDLETYTLKVTAHNPGATIEDELVVLKIQRTNALGSTSTLTETQVVAPVNDTTYVFEFEMDDSYAGQNTFSVQINHNLAAAETCYDNNLMITTEIVDSPLLIAPEYECVDSMFQCNVLINGGIPPYQLSSTADVSITELAFNIFQFQVTEDFSLTVLDANNESFTLGPISIEAEDPCAPPINIEESDLPDLKIAPNPTADYIQISWETPTDQLHLSLYDAKGQRLIEKMIQNHENLRLEDLPSGVYFLHLQGDKRQILRKIIKE